MWGQRCPRWERTTPASAFLEELAGWGGLLIRGYDEGYRLGCKGKKIEEHRAEERASQAERMDELERTRANTKELERNR